MPEKINVALALHPSQYLALSKIADAKSTPGRPVQVHHLLEYLVAQALAGPEPKKRPRFKVDREELRRLHGEGLNDREIGERLGVHQTSVMEHRHAMGLEKNSPNGRPRGTT